MPLMELNAHLRAAVMMFSCTGVRLSVSFSSESFGLPEGDFNGSESARLCGSRHPFWYDEDASPVNASKQAIFNEQQWLLHLDSG